MMTHEIGEAAGQVWHHLLEYGTTSLDALQEGTGLEASRLNRALGWLAREDKIRMDWDGEREMFTLTV